MSTESSHCWGISITCVYLRTLYFLLFWCWDPQSHFIIVLVSKIPWHQEEAPILAILFYSLERHSFQLIYQPPMLSCVLWFRTESEITEVPHIFGVNRIPKSHLCPIVPSMKAVTEPFWMHHYVCLQSNSKEKHIILNKVLYHFSHPSATSCALSRSFRSSSHYHCYA